MFDVRKGQIAITRGDTGLLAIVPTGYVPTSQDRMFFMVAEMPDGRIVINKTVTPDDDGVCRLVFSGTDTENLSKRHREYTYAIRFALDVTESNGKITGYREMITPEPHGCFVVLEANGCPACTCETKNVGSMEVKLESFRGPKGDRGETGPIGPQGPKGEKGDKGDKGEQGNTGPQGETGEKGDAFTYDDFTPEQLESLRGPKGDTGATGAQGAKGDKGDKGDTGAKGEPGKDAVIDATLTKEGEAADAKATGEAISQLKDDIGQLDTIVGYTFQNGYYTTNNQFVTDDTGRRSVTDYLFCKGGSTVEVMGDTANQYVNVVIFFDESKTPISGVSNIGAKNEYHTVNIPRESVYIRVVKDNLFNFSVKFKESGIVYQINEAKKSVNELAEKQKTKEKVSPYTKYVDSISDNDVIELRVPAVKYDYVLTFSANVTTFNSIKISRDLGTWTACYMIIDSTNFYIYSGQSLVYQKAHELNITDRLSVSLIAKNDLTAKVIVNTVGGSFTKDNLVWNGSKEPFEVQSIGSTLTKCELKYMCNAIWYDIWGFGDSYFDMWVQNARALGFSNWLVDGYTGRGSTKALESLNMLLELRKPKVIAWFMGMNDPDTSTTVNGNWLNTFNQVKTICEESNIDLWLCTIPNVPNRNNSLKNNVITSSNYRYVNVNNAVGGNVTSNWFDGLLSSDNVHPSELGRDRIANAVANAFPELCKIN